jgi:hypothetical protein
MNAAQMYNKIEAGWKTQTTHSGLTGEACHGLMHLDSAWNRLLPGASGEALSQAYDDEVATCVACQSGRS